MPFARPLMLLAALIGLTSVAPATAADVERVVNKATLSFDAATGRQAVASNTVEYVIEHEKVPTRLSFRLAPRNFEFQGLGCTSADGRPLAIGAPVDAAQLASSAPMKSLDITEAVVMVLENEGGNRDPNVRETARIDVRVGDSDRRIQLTETAPDSGIFAGAVPPVTSALDPDSPVARALTGPDGKLLDSPCVVKLMPNVSLSLSFSEDQFSLPSTTSILVDPAGYIYDSLTGALVNGATVSLYDANNRLAEVYGDDGVSRYPSTVISGTGATDANGHVYTFLTGSFRFPLVAPGTYHIVVTPPDGYVAPSTRSVADLAKVRDPTGAPYIINDASFGRTFVLSTPDPFYTDIPLDRIGSTSLVLQKSASVREASPGDFVQYKVTLTNRGTRAATAVHLTDILPAGLRYERGSTRGAAEPTASADGRDLTFTLPSAPATSVTDITYVVTIAPNAPTGEALNRVIASGSDGATSNEAAAAVRIRPALFTDGFTLIGRVTEGGCGDPGRGRKGVGGIRLLLEDGTFVATDPDGFYHVEGVRPGRHVVQLDTGSVPASYEPVACDADTRAAGSAISRFVEAEGGLLKRVDFQLRATGRAAAADAALPVTVTGDAEAAGDRDWLAGQTPGVALLFPTPDYNPRAPVTRVVVKHLPGQHVALRLNGQAVDPIAFDTITTNDAKTIALSRWTGISLRDGDNALEARVLDADGTLATTLTRIVRSSSIGVRAVFVPEHSRLVADGLTRPLVAVRVTDRDGHPVRAGTLVPFRVDQPYSAAIDPTLEQGNQLAGRGRAQTTARVVGDDGLAFLALQPTTQAGNVHLVVTLAGEKAERASDIRAWLAASTKQWIVVGFGAGTLGYDTLASHATTLTRARRGDIVTDGQLAFYAKGRIKGSWLLTMSLDSDRRRDPSRGLLGTIDPDRYYTVYGDGSRQAYDAPTERKLYLRLERRDFYALFGDFESGLTDTHLARFSRTLNGAKAEVQNGRLSAVAFAARSDQRFGRDELQGNGLSGPYRLSARGIVPNSDKLRIEVRDRVRPELVVSSTLLTRHIDYDIDPVAGTIRFREPVLGRDADFNPVFIVAEYETYGATDRLVAGARAATKLVDGRVLVGASLLRDESAGKATVAGVDLKVKPTPGTELRGELAGGGRFGLDTGRAWLAELEHHDAAVDLTVYARRQDMAFGLGQQNIVEAGTRKLGVDTRIALADKLSLAVVAWNAQQLDGPGSRTAADLRLEYRRPQGTLFVGAQVADDQGVDAAARRSRLLTLGGAQSLLGGDLTLAGQVQVAPGGDKASVDFPTRQQLTATLRVRDGVRLLGGYEVADGKEFTAHTARVGFDVAPWAGAKLMTTVNQQAIGENGERTYAQYGLSQSLPLGKAWTVDATLDASQTVKGRIPQGAFVNAFASTGSGSTAGTYGNDGDYVAVTGGAAYRADRWSWNGRVEYRQSDASSRWGITTDALRALGEGRTLAASIKYYHLADRKGPGAASLAADVALAVRPPDSRWSVLDRLQLRRDSADAGFTDSSNALGVPAYGNGFQATLRLVNNLAVNYRTGDEGNGHGFEATVYYGAKWVRGSFGADDYQGYVDAIGVELRQDISRRVDLGLQGSMQNAWTRGVHAFSVGPSVGASPAKDVWVTAGYNATGYRDRDFSGDRYTRKGPYLTLRLKFDQRSLAGRP